MISSNSYGELHLSPVWKGRDFTNGRFLKGHTPANKGKKWNEYLSKRKQKNCKKGWVNLDIHRRNGGGPNSGRLKKPVIAVTDEGKFKFFSYVDAAAKWCNGNRFNVGRCCRQNQSGTIGRKGAVNTDHRYRGIRFYFENDVNWIKKIHSDG